jgi:putative ABC transport system permease protein
MKYLHLVWSGLFRRKARTVFTLLSIAVAFLLFGLLDSVREGFANVGSYFQGADRRITISRVSYTLPLPRSLYEHIRAVPGVADVSFATWFGGFYQDPKNFFAGQAVSANYVALYPELQLAPEQDKAFRETRTGALAGEGLARQFNWKIGDKIPLQTPFAQRDGSRTWTFDLVGIYRTPPSQDKSQNYFENTLLVRWDYFDEARQFDVGTVGFYVVKVADSKRVDQIGNAIDALSRGSDHETKTQSEQALSAAFYGQLADVGLIVHGIMAAVFFTLVLLTGNTMMQAVRERTAEIGTLKSLGFKDFSILALVLGESLLMLLFGGGLGLLVAVVAAKGVPALIGDGMPVAPVGPAIWLRAALLMVVVGVAVGAIPAIRGMRLRIVDALR